MSKRIVFMRVALPGIALWLVVFFFVDTALARAGLGGGIFDFVRGFVAGSVAAECFDLWWRQFKDVTESIWRQK